MPPQGRTSDDPDVSVQSDFHHTLIANFRVLGIDLAKDMCDIYEKVHITPHFVGVVVIHV